AKKSARCLFHDDKHNSFSVWKNGVGLWFWKCHTGCGQGDEIDFLARYKNISKSDAIKLFLEMAGVAKPGGGQLQDRRSNNECRGLIYWQRGVDAFTDKHVEQLAEWRGYSIEFCFGLKQSRLIGLYENCTAFPVHDHAGNVPPVHYRLKDGSWRYYPQGTKVRPLVMRELVPGEPVHVFESQWVAVAFMDGERGGIIITRGASNGALVADLIPQSSTVYVWTQNDAAG